MTAGWGVFTAALISGPSSLLCTSSSHAGCPWSLPRRYQGAPLRPAREFPVEQAELGSHPRLLMYQVPDQVTLELECVDELLVPNVLDAPH